MLHRSALSTVNKEKKSKEKSRLLTHFLEFCVALLYTNALGFSGHSRLTRKSFTTALLELLFA